MEHTESSKENYPKPENIDKLNDLLNVYLETRDALFAKYDRTPPALTEAV